MVKTTGIRVRSRTVQPIGDLRAANLPQLRRGIASKWFRIVVLLIADIVALSVSWALSNRLGTYMSSPWQLQSNPISLVPVVGIVVSIIAARGLYGAGSQRKDYRGIFKAVVLGNAVLLLVAFFYAPDQFVSRSHFLYFLLFSIFSVCLSHYGVDRMIRLLREKEVISCPVYLIADADIRAQAIELINQENRYTIQGIAAAACLDRAEREATFERLRRLGITEAFVTWDAIKRRLFLAWHFQRNGITLRVIPIKDEPLFQGASLWVIGGLPSLSFNPPLLTGIDFKIKQFFDFASALLLLIVLSPVYFLIALVIRLDSPGPIFYRQTRIGLHGRRFKVWKFRSMVVNADQLQKELEAFNKTKDGILFKMEDDPRITKVGNFIRKYSLDELPQIFNVLCGQMSLVGPRPLPVRDVEQFSEHHFIRHEVLPGITGLWQVSGRSDIENFEDVLRLDLDYIENWSLWLDISILLRTVEAVFKKSGAY